MSIVVIIIVLLLAVSLLMLRVLVVVEVIVVVLLHYHLFIYIILSVCFVSILLHQCQIEFKFCLPKNDLRVEIEACLYFNLFRRLSL